MKALILNGSRRNENDLSVFRSLVENELKNRGYAVEALLLHTMEIAPCKGCFGCWTTTPGVCTTDDAGRAVVRRIFASDWTVMLTPVTFGGYSSELKKALDRIICLISPLFVKVNGSVRHRMRYDRYPKILVAGVLEKDNPQSEAIFRALVERNARNLHSTSFLGDVFVGYDERRAEQKFSALLQNRGGAA